MNRIIIAVFFVLVPLSAFPKKRMAVFDFTSNNNSDVRAVISPLTNWKYYLIGIKGWTDITALSSGKRVFYSDMA